MTPEHDHECECEHEYPAAGPCDLPATGGRTTSARASGSSGGSPPSRGPRRPPLARGRGLGAATRSRPR